MFGRIEMERGRRPVKATLGTTFCCEVMKVCQSAAALATSSCFISAQKPPQASL
jgi:hypothetical protein